MSSKTINPHETDRPLEAQLLLQQNRSNTKLEKSTVDHVLEPDSRLYPLGWHTLSLSILLFHFVSFPLSLARPLQHWRACRPAAAAGTRFRPPRCERPPSPGIKRRLKQSSLSSRVFFVWSCLVTFGSSAKHCDVTAGKFRGGGGCACELSNCGILCDPPFPAAAGRAKACALAGLFDGNRQRLVFLLHA